jgi:hypothetical protein
MKAFLSIKYHPDGANRPLIEAICTALEGCGIRTVCVARDVEAWGAHRFAPEELMRRTFAVIDACDVVVVELSEKGVGVGIEAGYAHARGKPLFTLARRGCEVSETLGGISRRVWFYEHTGDLDELARNLLGDR